MGIRYYAYPLRDEDVVLAHTDPDQLLSNDHFMDAFSQSNDEQCCLDKCWPMLQRIFHGTAAHQFLRGDVTMSADWMSYEAYVGVVSKDEMSNVADALEAVSKPEVEAFAREGVILDDDIDYVDECLGRAKHFARSWAGAGLGAIYIIR